VFENRMRRKIVGPKSREVMGCWRRLRNEELQNLYASPSIIRVIKLVRMRLTGNVAWMAEMRNADSILAGKLEGKRPDVRP
jgi:hypothetical protein